MPKAAAPGSSAKRRGRVRIADMPGELIVAPGTHPKLHEADAARTLGWQEEDARRLLSTSLDRLAALQNKLYADGRFPVLIVLQGIDCSGKDGTIRHVMHAFNTQGCTVTSFKVPTAEEASHDYLWRIHQRLPARREIGVFNRSHYEDIIVPRVDELVPQSVWKRRYDEINEFERMLTADGMRIVKIFLHLSKDEQKRRIEARLEKPHKQWKFELADLDKRKQWKDYRAAFEDVLAECSTQWAPWYLVPADHKWFRNFAVSQILVRELEKLPLRFPKLKFDPDKIRVR